MKKIITFNILLIVIILIISEIISYFFVKNTIGDYRENFNQIAKANTQPLMSLRYNFVKMFNQHDYDFMERLVCYGSKTKKSLLFFGCSYIYGTNVEENATIPYIVNKITNRTTVNKGIVGGSIINTLINLTDENFYNIYKDGKITEPEYVIYTYINDHLGRINSLYKVMFISGNLKYEIMPNFEYKNGQIKIIQPYKILYPLLCLYTAKAISFYNSYYSHSVEQQEEKMCNLLQAAKNITDKKFQGSKFVVLIFKDTSHFGMSESLQNKLTESGFIVLDAEQLAGHELDSDEWRGYDHEHPNEKSFKDVTEGLVKTLKL